MTSSRIAVQAPTVAVDSADWLVADIDRAGCAQTGRIISPQQCRSVAGLYDQVALLRSTVDMERHRFGAGQHRYFDAVRSPQEYAAWNCRTAPGSAAP